MTTRNLNHDLQGIGGWRIEPDAPDAAAYAALADDRAWNGYSIADLAPPLRQHTRVALARPADAPPAAPAAAACLFLRHPTFCSTVPHGDPAGLAAILDAVAAAGDLPDRTYILARDEHRPTIERHYAAPHGWQAMLRLAVDAATFRPPVGPPDAPVARLGPADLPALLDLYAAYGESAFTADQLLHGVFYGVRDGDALLAAGGTHVVAPRYGIAAVGNVYTRPAARGRGYGSALTAAVVRDLLAGPCRDVILNVAAANTTARAIYRRLGFREACAYWEGAGVRQGP